MEISWLIPILQEASGGLLAKGVVSLINNIKTIFENKNKKITLENLQELVDDPKEEVKQMVKELLEAKQNGTFYANNVTNNQGGLVASTIEGGYFYFGNSGNEIKKKS